MKLPVAIAIIFLKANLLFAQTPSPASHLIDSVFQKAKTEKKNIFILFTASWCGPCKELKRALYDEYNVQFFKNNYVLLELYGSEVGDKKKDENPGTKDIIVKFDGDTSTLPYWVILNSKGIKLQDNYIKVDSNSSKRENIGFSYIPKYLWQFLHFIKQTSKLTKAELQMIYDRCQQLNRITPKDD
ncbi:thioredoxin family protein [Ferruginibacter sp.]